MAKRQLKKARHSEDTSRNAREANEIVGKISTGNKTTLVSPAFPCNHTTFIECLNNFEEVFRPTNRYVLTYAHASLYKDSPRHALVVQKAPGTLHTGLFNLPGGKIKTHEWPQVAALRELKEETGLHGNFPQLIGAILPSGTDSLGTDFIVYVYRCMLNPGGVLRFPASQPASWQLIEEATNGKFVPPLAIILPLIAAGMMGWVLQDNWWGLQGSKQSQKGNFQSTVTFLRHSVSDAANQKKQRFTT